MDNLLCLRPVVLFTKDFACSSYRLSLYLRKNLMKKMKTILLDIKQTLFMEPRVEEEEMEGGEGKLGAFLITD